MKSVLLGGLKVWLLNDGGKPLSAPGGRAKFFTAGTSTPETVYSDIDLTQETALGPIVYTDELGYLPAIWLKTDRLYKVCVEQKVPGSNSQWTLLWEVDNVGYIDRNISDEIGNVPLFVNSISELKTIDHDENPVVEVLGYYSPGDWGSPSVFVFDNDCTKAPDDGAYVLPSDQEPSVAGRWVQQFEGDVLDVRKFGALPDISENSDCNAKIINAVTYSQSLAHVGKTPVAIGFIAPGVYDFVGGFDFSIYYWTDLSDNSRHDIRWIICNDVVLNGVSVNNLATTFKLDKNTDCRAVGELVKGNTLLVIEGGGSIKVDPAWWGIRACSVEDCYVRCGSLTTNDKNFTRCVVDSSRMLDGNVSLEDMDFKEDWFKDGYSYSNLSLQDVVYGVLDCHDAGSYVDIKNALNDPSYGDLCEQTLSNKTLIAGAIVENASFDRVTIQGSTELHNVSGSVIISGSSLELNAVDAWLYVQNSAVATSISVRRGYIGGTSIQVVSSLALDNVDVNIDIDTRGASSTVRNSVINNHIQCSDITLEYNVINNVVSQTDVNSVVTVDVRQNKFNGPNGKHSIEPTNSNSVVSGGWIGNDAQGGNSSYLPIVLDMTHLLNNDSLHTYRYENNTGKFLPKKSSCVVTAGDAKVFESPSHASGYAAAYPDSMPTVSLIMANSVLASSDNWMLASSIYIKNGVRLDMPFFGIGQATINLRVTVSLFFTGAYINGQGMSGDVEQAFDHSTLSSTKLLTFCNVVDPMNFNASSLASNASMGPAWLGFNRWTTPGWASGGSHNEGDPGLATLMVEIV